MPILDEALRAFTGEFGLHPVVGLEVEWYIRPRERAMPYLPGAQERDGYLDALRLAAAVAGLKVESFDAERGEGQFEAALPYTRDLNGLLSTLDMLKDTVRDTGERRGYVTDFSAKPYPDTYGSGLHVHLHLENEAGENIFSKQEENLSEPCGYVLAGLLAVMPRDMEVFAPTASSRERFVPGWHAPVKACWGGNNRTVALRLPDGTGKVSGAEMLATMQRPTSRRIEHRVAGSDADTALVIAAILDGVAVGLRDRLPLPLSVHGDAGDAQYDFPLLVS